MYLSLIFIMFCCIFKGTAPKGTLLITFIKYESIKKRSKYGTRCPYSDVRRGERRCKNIFEISLSDPFNNVIKMLQTKEFPEEDSAEVYFRNELNNAVANPLRITETKLEDVYQLKVDIKVGGRLWDTFTHTLKVKDYFSNKIKLPLYNTSPYEKVLEVEVRAYCSPTFAEPHCNTKTCVPRDDDGGHYNCTKDGFKVCLPGWKNITASCIEAEVATTSVIQASYSIMQHQTTSKSQSPAPSSATENSRISSHQIYATKRLNGDKTSIISPKHHSYCISVYTSCMLVIPKERVE